jgi:hypothetical protein
MVPIVPRGGATLADGGLHEALGRRTRKRNVIFK